MPEIIVRYTQTEGFYYDNYAKLVYDISYSTNSETQMTTASIDLDFYIRTDAYITMEGSNHSLYIGYRKGSSTAPLVKTNLYSGNKDIAIGSYNYVAGTSFDITYDGTTECPIYLAVGYENNLGTYFSPFYMPQSDDVNNANQSYEYTTSGANCVVLQSTVTNTKCTAPTNAYVNKTIFNDDVTLTWRGALSGLNNDIVGYELEYRTTKQIGQWSQWQSICSVGNVESYDYYPSDDEGSYIQARVRAKGSAGESFYSDWKEFPTVKINSKPTNINSISLSSDTFSNGDTIKLTWDRSYDDESNFAKYEILYKVNNGNWVFLNYAFTNQYYFECNDFDNGDVVTFKIRAIDTLSKMSDYTESGQTTCVENNDLYVCTDGVYVNAQVYICENSDYKKVEIYCCKNGAYQKGK